jgi:hypothetical protein
MKSLAGHNYKGLLVVSNEALDAFVLLLIPAAQASMPTFEKLIGVPALDDIVQDMLFEMNVWSSLASMRQHTDQSLARFGDSRWRMCADLRKFLARVCPEFATTSLPSEVAAAGRRRAQEDKAKSTKAAPANKGKAKSKGKGKAGVARKAGGAVKKVFSLSTPKFHNLGHYDADMLRVGPIEGVSSVMVRIIKSFDYAWSLIGMYSVNVLMVLASGRSR